MLNRIQKLLLHEYREFDEAVLVESPFAEVNEQGYGMRQVEIAITVSKLIIASDIITECDESFGQNHGNLKYLVDPEIENLELVTIIPLGAIKLKVYFQANRQILRICFARNKFKYFEFGGYLLRNMFWSLWRDRIRATKFCKYIESASPSIDKTDTDASLQLSLESCNDEKSITQTSIISEVVHENESTLGKLTPKALKHFIRSYNLNWPNSSSSKSSSGGGTAKNSN